MQHSLQLHSSLHIWKHPSLPILKLSFYVHFCEEMCFDWFLFGGSSCSPRGKAYLCLTTYFSGFIAASFLLKALWRWRPPFLRLIRGNSLAEGFSFSPAWWSKLLQSRFTQTFLSKRSLIRCSRTAVMIFRSARAFEASRGRRRDARRAFSCACYEATPDLYEDGTRGRLAEASDKWSEAARVLACTRLARARISLWGFRRRGKDTCTNLEAVKWNIRWDEIACQRVDGQQELW